MPTKDAVTKNDHQLRTSEDWVVALELVWGMPKDLTTLEKRAKLSDLGLVLTPKDSKGL